MNRAGEGQGKDVPFPHCVSATAAKVIKVSQSSSGSSHSIGSSHGDSSNLVTETATAQGKQARRQFCWRSHQVTHKDHILVYMYTNTHTCTHTHTYTDKYTTVTR